MSLVKRIKAWYQGVQIVIDIPSRKIGKSVFVGASFVGSTRYHWSAKVARRMVAFYLNHWQWLWGLIAVAVTSAVVAFFS